MAMEGLPMVETEPVLTADERLLVRLRAGDERAFLELIGAYGPLMLRLALGHVRSRAVAEEVVQEAWLGVLKGLDAFEGRSSLKTWILRILVNIAKSRGVREARCLPFSSLGDADDDAPAVDTSRFLPADHPRWPGHWAIEPRSWAAMPDEQILGCETIAMVRRAIEGLPPRQQAVIVLRDVEGWDGAEVCAALQLSEGNQRLLLHRARSRVRAELACYLEPATA
jgi:RNA polymerase sigma-70 factor (ECF subfamily)